MQGWTALDHRFRSQIQIIGETQKFYRQRIPESSCVKKETVVIYILITSRNGDRRIRQSIRNKQTSIENKQVEPVEAVQMSIYQSNTFRKDLSWLHFDNEPRVQERQQVKNQQSCISVFAAYLTVPCSNQEHQQRRDNIPCMAILQIYRDTE